MNRLFLKIKGLLLALGFILLVPSSGFAKEVKISANVDKNIVETGEIFTYTVKITGKFSSPRLIPPEFKNFKVVSQKQSKKYSFKKGEVSAVFSMRWRLFAAKPGVFTIKGARLKDGNDNFESKSLKIKVKGRALSEKRRIYPYLEGGTQI